MHFITPAELDLGTLQATGAPPVEGTALVFTVEHGEDPLASVEAEWCTHLPSLEFWQREAPDATWYGAFAVAERGLVTSPPTPEDVAVALVVADQSYPGTILNETGGEEVFEFERYLIAGRGDVPNPPPGQQAQL